MVLSIVLNYTPALFSMNQDQAMVVFDHHNRSELLIKFTYHDSPMTGLQISTTRFLDPHTEGDEVMGDSELYIRLYAVQATRDTCSIYFCGVSWG